LATINQPWATYGQDDMAAPPLVGVFVPFGSGEVHYLAMPHRAIAQVLPADRSGGTGAGRRACAVALREQPGGSTSRFVCASP